MVRLLLPPVRKRSGPYSYSPGTHTGHNAYSNIHSHRQRDTETDRQSHRETDIQNKPVQRVSSASEAPCFWSPLLQLLPESQLPSTLPTAQLQLPPCDLQLPQSSYTYVQHMQSAAVFFNPLKRSGIRWLHLKVFSASTLLCDTNILKKEQFWAVFLAFSSPMSRSEHRWYSWARQSAVKPVSCSKLWSGLKEYLVGIWHYIQGVKYSIEASSSINTGVETTRSHLAD